MTVTSETSRASYNGDSSTVVFTVPFYFLEDSSIAVTLVASDETETTQVLNTDYTVTDAGELAGGSITMATAPAVGEMLVIIRDEDLTQTTDYIENDAFPAESHERALDKAMMINQQQQEELARCITAPVGDDGTTDYTLPTYEALSYLQWHPTTKMLRNAELTATGTATIGTDVGDLVELVTVSGSAGFPVLKADNMTVGGDTLKGYGTAEGDVVELLSGGVFPLSTLNLIDEDDMTSDVNDQAPTQQSVKAYVDSTPICKSAFFGLAISNDTDTEHDILLTAGQIIDSTNSKYLELLSDMTKQIDSAWAVGDNAGGLFSGTVANNTTYHIHLIEKDSDGSIDWGFDTSITAANKPSGYTKYNYVRSVKTDGSANIRNFIQEKDVFTWESPEIEYTTAGTGTSSTTIDVNVPTGISTLATMNVESGAAGLIYFRDTRATDIAPVADTAPLATYMFGNDSNIHTHVQTDVAGQIAYRASIDLTLQICTISYIHQRF